jgi:hypothetical protein
MKTYNDEIINSYDTYMNKAFIQHLNSQKENLKCCNFFRLLTKAKDNLADMINGNEYFSYKFKYPNEADPKHNDNPKPTQNKHLYKHRYSQKKILNLSLNSKIKSENETKSSTTTHITNMRSITNNTKNKRSSFKRRTTLKRRTLFSKPYEIEFFSGLSQMYNNNSTNNNNNNSSLLQETTQGDNSSLPIIMKQSLNKDQHILMLDNKTFKRRRNGGMLRSGSQVNYFVDAIQQKLLKPKNNKSFSLSQSPSMYSLFKPCSTFHTIYLKCNTHIRNSEEIDNYLSKKKIKDSVHSKHRNKSFNESIRQIEHNLLIDNSVQQSNTNIINLMNTKSNNSKLKELNRKNQMKARVQKLDVIAKLSEGLAFKNRSSYLNEFKFDYDDDKDFIFHKDFYKIKPYDCSSVNNNNNKIKQSIRKNERNSSNKNNKSIEQILNETEKDKALLIKRIENSQKKYQKEKRYFMKLKKHDDKSTNSSTYIDIMK